MPRKAWPETTGQKDMDPFIISIRSGVNQRQVFVLLAKCENITDL